MNQIRLFAAALACLLALPAAAQIITWDADQVVFDDAEDLQQKLDEGALGDVPRVEIPLPSFAGQQCGENGCYERGGINWVPLHPWANFFGYVNGATQATRPSVPSCGDSINDYIPTVSSLTSWAVNDTGTTWIEFASGQEAEFCRDSTPVANGACGGGTYYPTCTSGAGCAGVQTGAFADSVVFYDDSAELFRVVPVYGYQGCDSATERLSVSGMLTDLFAPGDLAAYLLNDRIHPSRVGSGWMAQRVLDARRPEVLKNNLFPWGDGETHEGVAAIDAWTLGGTGTKVATAYDPDNATFNGAANVALVGGGVSATAIAANTYLETSDLPVYPGVYQWKCSFYSSGINSDIRVRLVDDAAAEVAASQRSDMEELFGGPWVENGSWEDGHDQHHTYGRWSHAIGLLNVGTESSIKLRIEEEGAGGGRLYVDECGFERAPVQSMDWSKQYRLPAGTYALRTIGDSRAVSTGARLPDMLEYLQTPPNAWRSATPFRADVTFTNDIPATSSAISGGRLSDQVGELATFDSLGTVVTDHCTASADPANNAAPAGTAIADAVSTPAYTATVFVYGINDVLGGRVTVEDNANGPCQTFTQTLSDLDGVLRNGKTSLNLYLGPTKTRAAVGAGGTDFCFAAAGTRRSCGLVFDDWIQVFEQFGQ